MANTVAYNNGSNPVGSIKKGVMSINIDNSLIMSGLTWRNGIEIINQYIIYSDTYTQGIDTEGNAKPCAWSCDYNDTALLNLINSLPALINQPKYGTLATAIAWLEGQNKYFLVNQSYPEIVTSGMTLCLDAGMTGSYPNAETTWYDLSGGLNSGTLFNGPVWNSFGVGSNITFDGSNDYYEITNRDTNLEFQPNQPYSCFVLFKSPPTNELGALISNMVDGGSPAYPGWDIWFNHASISNTIAMHLISNWFTDAIKVAVDYSYSSLANRWLSFGYTYDGSCPTNSADTLNSVNFYFNGQLYNNGKQFGQSLTEGSKFTSSASTITYNPNQRFRIATRWLSGGGSSSNTQESVAKVLVYNRELTNNEFLQNHFQGKLVTSGLTLALDAGNLVSYAGAGTTWYDMTSNGNNGTLTNGPTYSGGTVPSIVFDGVDDYVSLPNNQLPNNFTYSIWVMKNGDGNQGGRGIVISNGSTYIDVNFSNRILFSLILSDGSQNLIQSANGVVAPVGVWAHYTATYNQQQAKLYYNGVEVATSNYTLGVGGYGTLFTIGMYDGGSYNLNGKISNAQLYNRALSASEISQNFNTYRRRYGI